MTTAAHGKKGKKIIVVGGVAGGMSAASKAKRLEPSFDITVYEKSGYISYGACGMPYVIGGDIADPDDLIARTPEKMAEKGITAKVRHEVLSVDPKAKTVTVKNLGTGETFSDTYDTLVLATGASPVWPELPGADLKGVHVLRTMEDMAAIQATLAAGAKRAAIVGGSYIGLELAEALHKRGLAVRVLEAQDVLLGAFGPLPSKVALEEVTGNGIAVQLGTKVTSLGGREQVERVETDAGTFPTELVIFAVGAKPNNALAKQVGLELGPAEAILTDDGLRTSEPDIYAVGDVTAVKHLVTGDAVWLPLGDTANKQGRLLGARLGGQDVRFRGVVGTAIVKVFERGFATTGLTVKGAEDAGFDVRSSDLEATDHAGYYPDKRPLSLTLVWERGTGKLLGAQIVGYGDAVKRIDVIAALLANGGTLQDLADLDLAYAPPYSSAWDPLLVGANVALGL